MIVTLDKTTSAGISNLNTNAITGSISPSNAGELIVAILMIGNSSNATGTTSITVSAGNSLSFIKSKCVAYLSGGFVDLGKNEIWYATGTLAGSSTVIASWTTANACDAALQLYAFNNAKFYLGSSGSYATGATSIAAKCGLTASSNNGYVIGGFAKVTAETPYPVFDLANTTWDPWVYSSSTATGNCWSCHATGSTSVNQIVTIGSATSTADLATVIEILPLDDVSASLAWIKS